MCPRERALGPTAASVCKRRKDARGGAGASQRDRASPNRGPLGETRSAWIPQRHPRALRRRHMIESSGFRDTQHGQVVREDTGSEVRLSLSELGSSAPLASGDKRRPPSRAEPGTPRGNRLPYGRSCFTFRSVTHRSTRGDGSHPGQRQGRERVLCGQHGARGVHDQSQDVWC